MKAITCSQCGALITEITPESKLVNCDYCKAKIPVINEKILEISNREAEEAEKYRQEWKRNEEKAYREYREREANEAANHNRWMIIQIVMLLTILTLPFLLYYLFNG
jgi:hypothetical protein